MVPTVKLLPGNFYGVVPTMWFLRCGSCGVVSINWFLQQCFCGVVLRCGIVVLLMLLTYFSRNDTAMLNLMVRNVIYEVESN